MSFSLPDLTRGITPSASCLLLFLTAVGVAAAHDGPRSQRARRARVLNGLRPPVAVKGQPDVSDTLRDEMALNHVPGVSVAVIDGGRIAWAEGFGVREAGRSDPVTARTLFEAQSISKAVTATAALRLVGSGRLSLDEPVNDYLRSWKIPDNAFQATEKVTLRRILSHSAGLTVGGMEGYRSGDALPTLRQVLDGEKPANNPPVRVDFTPGSRSRYSGGGFVVLQQLLMDVTGRPFPELMERLVLSPAGMTSSTFEQPLPEARWAEAAVGHDDKGVAIRGRWPIHPETAAGGLWATPTDLARWALAVTRAWEAEGGGLFPKRVAVEMLTVQRAPYGLGVELQGTGKALEFSHTGSNHGYRAVVVMFPAVGKGAVVMANGDRGDAVIGNLVTSIATEYHWPARTQVARATVPLSEAQVEALLGVYALPPAPDGRPVTFAVTRVGDRMYGQFRGLGPRPKLRLFPAGATSLFSPYGLDVSFALDSSGRASGITFGAGDIVGRRKQ